MKLYCVNNIKRKSGTAGAKAPADISTICKEIGAELIDFVEPRKFSSINKTRFFAFFDGISNWINLFKIVEKNSSIIVQHPYENIMVAFFFIDLCKKIKNIQFICFIHDLDSLRKSFSQQEDSLNRRNNLADTKLLQKCNTIICHNSVMKNYLIKQGFKEKNIIELVIFDYLHECELPVQREKNKEIIIAGNLLSGKCKYLYRLCEEQKLDFTLNLYGPNYTGPLESDYVNYYGSLPPDILPGEMKGSFGLVWDGEELDRCAGNAGEYVKYNNPHKCSLFLASNIPVIIWREAALAEFVENNKVGIVVDSILDIANAIDNISNEEYNQMLLNTIEVGKKLRAGFYTKKALNDIHSN